MPRPLSRTPYAAARWLVLAPHPDDETIGAGALIADVAGRGRLAAVVYLTDGSGSHPLADARDRARLIACRAGEARRSLRRLAGEPVRTVWLGWRDGQPFAAGSAGFVRAARRLAWLVRTLRVDAVAVTAADETHGDHAAAFALVRAAGMRTATFAYRVWGGPMPRAARPPIATAAIPPGRRRHALAAHRSQMTASRGAGFRVPPALRRMPARDLLYPVARDAV